MCLVCVLRVTDTHTIACIPNPLSLLHTRGTVTAKQTKVKIFPGDFHAYKKMAVADLAKAVAAAAKAKGGGGNNGGTKGMSMG